MPRCNDALEERLGEVGDAGVEDLAGDGGEVGDDVSVGVADAGEQSRGEVDAGVGEDGVSAGHVDGCGVIGADGNGRCAACVEVMPAERARAATLPKPTFCARAMVAMLSEWARAVGGGDHAGVLAAFEVARGVGMAVSAEVLGVVVEAGERGEGAACRG